MGVCACRRTGNCFVSRVPCWWSTAIAASAVRIIRPEMPSCWPCPVTRDMWICRHCWASSPGAVATRYWWNPVLLWVGPSGKPGWLMNWSSIWRRGCWAAAPDHCCSCRSTAWPRPRTCRLPICAPWAMTGALPRGESAERRWPAYPADGGRVVLSMCAVPAYNQRFLSPVGPPTATTHRNEASMFTGIIEAIGQIASLQPRGGDVRVQVRTGKLDLGDVRLGDSIAVNGVCLTVVELPGDGFWADVSQETTRRSAFVNLKVGSRVNREKALTASTRLGGHLVSGHVDGVGTVLSRTEEARSVRFRVEAPAALARYIAQKGSITVDGTSLTVNGVDGAVFDLNIVPHTLQETIMGDYQPGTAVNLEVDGIARYLDRLLLGDRAAESGTGGGIDMAF